MEESKGVLKNLGGQLRAILKAIAPTPKVVAAVYVYGGLCFGSYYWGLCKSIEASEREIEKGARNLLEGWKNKVQAGRKETSLDEFRASLGLDGDNCKRFDKLFDEYRKYGPTPTTTKTKTK